MKHEKLEITAVDVRGFKRISHVHIETEDHRNILLIAGKNRQGKSSLMDALDAAFTGGAAAPAEPIRQGDEATTIDVELNDGLYKIQRTFKVGKEGKSEGKLLTTLTVKGPDGKLSSPQAWLDNLVAQRFLDPLEFLGKKPADQRKVLLQLIGVDLDALAAEHTAAFARRTEENRFLKQAQAQLDGIDPLPPPPPETRSMEALQEELSATERDLREGTESKATHERLAQKLVELEASTATRKQKVVDAEALLAKAKQDLVDHEARVAKGQLVVAEALAVVRPVEEINRLLERRGQIKAEQLQVSKAVQWETLRAARAGQQAKLAKAVATHEAEADKLTAQIKEIAQRGIKLLDEAKMPIEGLEVTATGLRLAGLPLEQASQAEQLRCSLAIAIASSPKLRDVWVKSGSLLDEEGLETVRQVAAALDCRVWLEMVNERPGDPRAIIIRDGQALGQVVSEVVDG